MHKLLFFWKIKEFNERTHFFLWDEITNF
jgi:hypothetical protein